MASVDDKLKALWERSGVALCGEAQADGVPCADSGRDCMHCAEAVRHLRALEAAGELEPLEWFELPPSHNA
jgi:hypothetical protein